MNFLSVFPVLSGVFGLFLIVFVLFNKSGLGKNKKIRYALSALLFIYVITSVDYYLSITDQINAVISGGTYFLYHFIGVLFYYFIALYTKSEINLKKWMPIVLGYTFLRILVFLPFDHLQNLQEFVASLETSNYGILILSEYIIVSMVNLILMVLAYKKLKGTPFVIKLEGSEKIHHKWIQIIFIAIILMQIVVFITTLVGSFDMTNFNHYLKFETLIYATFFFIFAFSIMHFPIFAYTGNYEDLPTSIEKYAKSSLSDSSELFDRIKTVVEEEQLYLDFDLKLNTVAERLGESLHHISQAINQTTEMSFPEFINSFRIEEAKKKLMGPKPDTIYAISLDVGFNSRAAFYAAFKKYAQMTPSEFKKLHNPYN